MTRPFGGGTPRLLFFFRREGRVGVRAYVSTHEELRRGRGLSQERLASALGVPASRVWRIEAGQARATPEYRRAFSRLVRVREEDIFETDGWAR